MRKNRDAVVLPELFGDRKRADFFPRDKISTVLSDIEMKGGYVNMNLFSAEPQQ